MKHYIIFTYELRPIGGTQALVAGRAKYLEQHGWIVYTFFNNFLSGECEIPSLTKYVPGFGFRAIGMCPYKLPNRDREEILNRMIDRLRIDPTMENEIIIESHYETAAYWAELLAERIQARHFFITCNEQFRGSDASYDENLDFFYFKELRGELISDPGRFQKLFNGYRGLQKSQLQIPDGLHICCEQDAVQDIENQDVDSRFEKDAADFTIASFGRTEKQYVPAIFRGAAEFSKSHPDKKIRFIIVGKLWNQNQLSMFNGIQNVEIIPLGNLVPIPRKLFKYIDVICAGSGTAMFCAYENVPVIIANAETDKTPGLLYYDTNDVLFGGDLPSMSYFEMLEKVLIRREYQNRKPNLPERHPADWHYEKLLEIMRSNQSELKYFTRKFNTDLRRNWIAQFPFHKMQPGARIVLYGAGDISKDYQKQIEDGKFCRIAGIVADDHENYDRTILPPEKLIDLEYDGIVIAELPNQNRIDEIASKIFRITGKRNFVYDWKILQIN